jgi:hypothetical protein
LELVTISPKQWNEFYKEYTIQFLTQPDYRLGQAFCNKFEVTDVLDKTYLLFYETSNEKAWDIIKNYIDGEVDGPFSK